MVSLMRIKRTGSTLMIRLSRLRGLFFLVLFAGVRLHAAVGDWKTYTSVRNVRQVACRDSLLWPPPAAASPIQRPSWNHGHLYQSSGRTGRQ